MPGNGSATRSSSTGNADTSGSMPPKDSPLKRGTAAQQRGQAGTAPPDDSTSSTSSTSGRGSSSGSTSGPTGTSGSTNPGKTTGSRDPTNPR